MNTETPDNKPSSFGLKTPLAVLVVFSAFMIILAIASTALNQYTHDLSLAADQEFADLKAREVQKEADKMADWKANSQRDLALHEVVTAAINRPGHDLTSLTDYDDGMTYDPVKQQIVITVGRTVGSDVFEDVRFQVTTNTHGFNRVKLIKPPPPAVPAP